MVRKALLFLFSFFLIFGFALYSQSGARTLEVTITYSGEGEVDSEHGLHVFVFDTPDISADSMPVGYKVASSNGESLVFDSLYASPVYLVAVYDSQGGYDPTLQGPPPAGVPVSIYGSLDGPTPVEIAAGETKTIEFTFDDSTRMP